MKTILQIFKKDLKRTRFLIYAAITIATLQVFMGSEAMIGNWHIQQQLSYQKDSGSVDPNTAIKMGQQIGAEYMMYGNLTSIVKRGGSSKDVYYKFTLKVLHVKTGLIEWSDEKEIRKSSAKSLFGL